jgi:hypothetical protein
MAWVSSLRAGVDKIREEEIARVCKMLINRAATSRPLYVVLAAVLAPHYF